MAIVSKLPFQLSMKTSFRSQTVTEGLAFYDSDSEAWSCRKSTFSIEENDDAEMVFTSKEENSKLYIDIFYENPKKQGMLVTSEGRYYRAPNEESFYLYKNHDGYEPIGVGIFLITVHCQGRNYYGTLEVLPKQMEMSEWILMQKNLEEEMNGLAKKSTRRNAGYADEIGQVGRIAPEKLAKFLILMKYAKSLTAAIMDIADKPRNQIVTTYDMVATDNACIYNRETMKRYARTGGMEATRKVPIKTVTYDIPENRMLKDMMKSYKKILDEFIEWMEETGGNTLYIEYAQTANKLRKLIAMLHQKEWYQQVARYSGKGATHSFIIDARYNIVYQIYNELRRDDVDIPIKMNDTHTWKRSSHLYEMWCFIKICHILAMEYTREEESWSQAFEIQEDGPVLLKGNSIRFDNEKITIYVQYDRNLPQDESVTHIHDPLYMTKMQNGSVGHNKPDITIQLYSKEFDCYIGSIILECKYRKMSSFWTMDSEWSSIGQIQTYYSNARSKYLYGDRGKRFNCNPVHQIIVLTPDELGDMERFDEFNILIKSFRPSKDEKVYDKLNQLLIENITNAMENCEFLINR